MEFGYNINDLIREAQSRWLKPAEILFILQNHEKHQLTPEPPEKPASGSLFLFNKRVLRFFRRDGHNWRKKKDGRTVGEAHERLKVGNVETLNCYYAHGEQNPNFQRRSYWMLDPAFEHIVLVHYRDVSQGRQSAVYISQSPSSSTFSLSSGSIITQHPGFSPVIGESYELNQSVSSGSAEIISAAAIRDDGVNLSGITEKTEEVSSSSEHEMSLALRRLEEQLSLNDESFKEISPFPNEDDNMGAVQDHDSYDRMHDYSFSLTPQQHSGDGTVLGQEMNIWQEMVDDLGSSISVSQTRNVHELDENGLMLISSSREPLDKQKTYNWHKIGEKGDQKSSSSPKEAEEFKHPAYSPTINSYAANSRQYTSFDQGHFGISFEDISVNIAQKQRFRIQEITPDWGYASDTTKVMIVGTFLCEPSECAWACMFGDTEVPVQIIQEGVMCCQAPPRLPGKVTLCITSGNRESCSEVREFDYHIKPKECTHNNPPESSNSSSPDELLLLVRFVQMLLSDSSISTGFSSESRTDILGNSRAEEDSWSQVIESILVGSSTSSFTKDWLLQELLKDKLQQWLSSRTLGLNDCSLSKKEQGIIHMIAGLGYEWALPLILSAGVSINFRDINGWTALHWAARFGREKMVAALIASGASAGAVTDPNSQDPLGKSPASIASACGYKGLAGYLSEMALTSHLSSLILEESEFSKVSANVEAENTVNSIPRSSLVLNEDHLSLKHTLAAVRNAAQAAARIQSAFRAHSFRKRRQRHATTAVTGDEYDILENDVHGLSAASKIVFGNARDYNSAALSIQKKYRGWKGRKDFLAFRQKVVKIQAHVRGYQVRKHYKVCWAVGILEKVVLRWRRRGAGLRGFRHEPDSIDENEDEDILKVFRKQKVDASVNEAVSRVLSMVDSPDARQQYSRLLEKYRQAKAKLEGAGSSINLEPHGDIFVDIEDDNTPQFM